MELPDAIIVLAAGIKRDASGRWTSTDLSAEDDKLGAPGGKLRVRAAAILATKYPTALVIPSGGKGYDVPAEYPEDRPLLGEILRDELVENGVPRSRIVLEGKSNTTYQQLQELETLIARRKWQSVVIVTSRYHLPRLHAMSEERFPLLVASALPVSAEDVLLEADPVSYGPILTEAYASVFMRERIAKETQGVLHIRDGTYQFR